MIDHNHDWLQPNFGCMTQNLTKVILFVSEMEALEGGAGQI